MSKKNNVVQIGDNYKNISITDELMHENSYLRDAINTAIKTIHKLTLGTRKVKGQLQRLKHAKNNWDRGVHADKALKLSNVTHKHLGVFEDTLKALHDKEDLYSPEHKSKTLELGADQSNFGMYFANSHKELQETIRASVQEWNKEFEEDE